MGKTPSIVTGKLVRDTGTGLIVEDARGVRYFARWDDVIERDDGDDTPRDDLFGPLT